MKNPVTPPGIDPGTVRLVAQRLKHYATLGLPKPTNNQQNALQYLCCILFTMFSPACFDQYSYHLQGAVITRIQTYKCGYLWHHQSVTIQIMFSVKFM
jgi:hypothetical protein